MLLWLNERGTKTRKGQQNGDRRPFSPKAYASNTQRCPVHFYKLFRTTDEASIQRQGSKVPNHSVRKTSIGRLLDANTPETFVAQLNGH
ncbi:PREDICTED: uncharacterized protein LOC107356652 [Acropora digitifera]|uniref:uncharacterized protein LOC107356652 n=1 Tax=Acropora digitifera TaxID=70779 RepID=UPI00077A23F6|nr:PREDICTED: uncharacterized protein LOC107356652 [Acropora digitifera]